MDFIKNKALPAWPNRAGTFPTRKLLAEFLCNWIPKFISSSSQHTKMNRNGIGYWTAKHIPAGPRSVDGGWRKNTLLLSKDGKRALRERVSVLQAYLSMGKDRRAFYLFQSERKQDEQAWVSIGDFKVGAYLLLYYSNGRSRDWCPKWREIYKNLAFCPDRTFSIHDLLYEGKSESLIWQLYKIDTFEFPCLSMREIGQVSFCSYMSMNIYFRIWIVLLAGRLAFISLSFES